MDDKPQPLNLPSYFLADLPPEAELTAGLITEACQTLKRNRERSLSVNVRRDAHHRGINEP